MLARLVLFAAVVRLADDGCGGGSTEPPAPSPVAAGPGRPKPGDPCVTRADCDDGLFCSGAEECLAGVCVSARNAACRAECGVIACQEAVSACVFRACESTACTRDSDCDDARSCTDDACVAGHCAHLPVDARCSNVGACGVGVCLGDEVADASGCGAKPDAARCSGAAGCSLDFACVALPASCATDRDCGNGNLCDGVERCVGGRCERGARTTCTAGGCQHASCSTSGVGDPWCKVVALARCP